MALSLKFLSTCLFVYCTSIFLYSDFCFACVFEKNGREYNLSALDWPGWQAVGKKNGSDIVTYDISICRPLNYTELCGNTSVCRNSSGRITEMGQFTLSNISVYDGVLQGGFMLFLTASECSPSDGTQYHAIINFLCGPTLGSPEVLMENECGVQFLWKTSAACKTAPRRSQVPCYVIDKEGNKRNLEGLAVLPMYAVLNPNPSESIYIRVCTEMNPGSAYCANCPPKTSAIRVINGKKRAIGQLDSKVDLTEEGLHLFYRAPPSVNDTLPEGCTMQPTTSIIFRCPERLKSRRPRIISDVDCQYEIEWETEYACPESLLKADFKTCKFTKEVHGIDLDLSPLKKTDGLYVVNVTSQTNVSYVFNICGGLGDYICNGTKWASSAVCFKNGSTSEILAITNSAKLMLVERQLSLRYEGPECREGKKHSTIFSFTCDHNAKNNGTGYPVHILSLDCTHFFSWETKYACLPYRPEIPCYVFSGGKYFDLRRLKKDHEFVWNVLTPRRKGGDRQLYFMNVCGPAFGTLPHTSAKCEGDPAVTKIENNTCVNLGEFTAAPSYDVITQSLKMEYTNGSVCRGNLRWSSVVEFKCYPGRFFSDVILTHVNEVGCVNEFEFRSAIACPSTVLTGKDCKLIDPETGLSIDLSSLNSAVYEVNSSFGKFYLSVCGSLPKNNTCVKLLNSSHDVAACVMGLNESDPSPQDIGAPSSQIGYVYGNVNLTYVGEKYDTLILFMCSIHGNNGTPVLSRIIGRTYVFHWYTSLVCPEPATTECLVTNPETGEQYDFSGLAKAENNWVSYFSETEGEEKVERKLYINICRSLNPAPSCDQDAAACIVTINGEKEEKYLPNVGRATSSPQLLSSDHLQVHYKDGKSCTAHGKNINYSTVVQFICSETDMARPRFIGKIGECQYSFLWTTKAACPLRMISVQNKCVLTDPGSGFTFDMTSLTRENPYTVLATNNQTYKLNICGPVKSGCSADNSKSNITACEVQQDGKITALSTTTNFTLQYIERRHLILTYFNKTNDSKADNSSEVIMTMTCDNSTSEIQPVFVKKEDERYYFELKTPLVCVQEVGSCYFHDSKGNEYDITTLFQSSKNWKVLDTKRSLVYQINFCRPLVKVPSFKFPGGAPGAVVNDLTSLQNVGVSLGVQLSEPTVSEDGTIIVHYTEGDFCREGLRRSARVTLTCSHVQGELVFMGETSECEYFFSMNTPAACSSQTAIGQNCIVTDPVYGYTFNLNYMKNGRMNTSVDDGQYKYYISICDKLTGFTGHCENSSVCQTKPDDPSFSKSLGLPNSNLVYSDGVITLTYNLGSICHNKYNRSAVIKITCLHPSGRSVSHPYFISEAEDCTYLFEWPMTAACPPFHLSTCSATDNRGHLYDLSELSLYGSNYYVRNPVDLNQTFVINVCKSVVYSPESICPYVSAACLLDPSNTDASKRSINLGQVTEGPHFEDGKLIIKYTSGEPCDLEKDSSAHFMETIIEFTCDVQKIKSEPQFVGRDVCTYYFTWSTAYACSLNDTEAEGKDGCIATDPYTGFEFNLSSLMRKTPYIIKTPDHQYFLNVCGDVKRSPCGSKTGVCQQELQGKQRFWSAGIANSKLLYQDGILFLNYSGGAPCHNNTYQRNTIIHFHCSVGPGVPHFLYESSDCTYYFTWGTEYACQSLVHCAVKNGSDLFDLTPLTIYPYHSADNHVDGDNASYFISVCSALIDHMLPASCPDGSAICRQSGDKAVSLGRVGYPPFVDFEGHATIIYTNGSQCTSQPGDQYKSRIIFICDPDEFMGKPVLVRVEDDVCMYIFEWRTNIICPLEPATDTPQSHSECIFNDTSSGVYFDLSPLKKIGSYYEADGGDSESKFFLNICGEVEKKGCGGSAVCLDEGDHVMNFGRHSSEKFTYEGSRLRVMYTDGEDCPLNVAMKKTSEIILVCSPNTGLGTPRLLRKKYSCLATFIWQTDVVCQDMKHSCAFRIGNKEIDIFQLSSLSHNWKATDSENNTYFLNLCHGLNQDVETKGCPTNAAVCMKKNSTFKGLGLVHTVTRNLTDSGDLVLTYTSGSASACPSVDSNVQQLSATTKITLICGTSLGQPTYVSGPDNNCIYHFAWETNTVCEGENEDLVYEGNGTLVDKRLGYEMDLSTILDRTYKVSGMSQGENYTYVINIGQGYMSTVSKADDSCFSAAVCQTKPEKNFYRDVGSTVSRRFREKGSELYLSLMSHMRGCGKNAYRNVTTLFILKCTSYAGDGSPAFMYESGGCDYIFNWDTNAVCSVAHRRVSPTESPSAQDNGAEEQVSHHSSSSPAVIITVLCIILILCPVVYIVSNKERRSAAAAKVRSAFHHVTLPHFRYRRADGEMLILINGTQVNQSDPFKDDDLLS